MGISIDDIQTDLFGIIADKLNLEKADPMGYSPLVLAYIGDAIYEVVIRTKVISSGNTQVNKMHKQSSSYVKAETQALIIKGIMDELSEEELRVYKRGRNAKSFTSAKNASIGDYRMATGFEALMGYLYLSGQTERMLSLILRGIEIKNHDGE